MPLAFRTGSRRLLVGVAVSGCIAAAAAALLASKAPAGNPPARISYDFAGRTVSVPTAWLRHTMDRAGGPAAQLDLAVPWPAAGDGHGGHIAVTLAPANAALDPSERPARLYDRFLAPETWSNPGGLVLRRFRDGTPFEGEDLYLAPPDGRRFHARCTRPGRTPDLPPLCTATLRQSGIDIELRFSPERLADWARLSAGAGRVLSVVASANAL